MSDCFFKCGLKDTKLSNCNPQRIIAASKNRCDDLHIELEEQLKTDPNLNVKCHRKCISTYTSKFHIQLKLKRKGDNDSLKDGELTKAKRIRRSEVKSFNFQRHCIFCGDECDLNPDPKNPSRWRKAYLCRTAERGTQCYKDKILEVCTLRNDVWGREVTVRIQGAVSDLHAADARYHDDCRLNFMSSRSIETASKGNTTIDIMETDISFKRLVDHMVSDKSRVWTSIDLHTMYESFHGTQASRRQVISNLKSHFCDELVILSSPGLADIVLFRNKAGELLKVVSDDEDTLQFDKITKQIVRESKQLNKDWKQRKFYNSRIDNDIAIESISDSLLHLLIALSGKSTISLPVILIANMITCIIVKHPTDLQIALGVLVREKKLLETLYDFGVTCSYDESLRFKSSAASMSSTMMSATTKPITDATEGLIQAVADNFDANISSQNGQKSTHALALLLTQTHSGTCTSNGKTPNDSIPRLDKDGMKEQLVEDMELQHYTGEKKPPMPKSNVGKSVLPLKVLVQQSMSSRRAQEVDFDFFKDILERKGTPEYSGFNTKKAREQGHALKCETKVMYTPLIDMTPSDPDTMMTAMVKAQHLTVECGQEYTVFTADQQLYRVAVNVLWSHPTVFPNFIPRLGGMHMIMSFVGCVGHLMQNSGLEEILTSAFGGVTNMLTGKKFPQNVRALRLLVEELLRGTIERVESHESLWQLLDEKSLSSRTAKHWVINVIKPVLIMMMFVRAEREGDWPLHLLCVSSMLPYFFASGHVNYARYGLYYLRSMENLPQTVLKHFLNGEHVMRHRPGFWNSIWSDMFIETTFMRYGHGPGGLIGITLNQSAIRRWALSLHICSQLIKDVNDMREMDANIVTVHKEERNARIESDADDRDKLRRRLEQCISPLDTNDHPDGIVNIVSGKISLESVNVDKAFEIGTQQLVEYERDLPESFHKAITNKVTTMIANKKSVKLDSKELFDTNLIYVRTMGMMATRDLDLKEIFKHELSPIPTSMFETNGSMRIAKSKAVLKKKLQVECTSRKLKDADAIVIDGCAALWVIHWPSSGVIADFVENFWAYITHRLYHSDVYLVFDRYWEDSIKSNTRSQRQRCKTTHQLRPQTPLPPQKAVLTSTDDKVQLIEILVEGLTSEALKLANSSPCWSNALVITGSRDTPSSIQHGVLTEREDLTTTHEEADVILVQQAMKLCQSGYSKVKVISDDTDVFVLLLHFYASTDMICHLVMEGSSANRSVSDIRATANRHSEILPSLLQAHALTGCDTVACLFGIGKGTVIKILQKGHALSKLGHLELDLSSVFLESAKFIGACYGSRVGGDISDVRFEMWSTKTGKQHATRTPELRCLPPTRESFTENVKRAHLQASIWLSALSKDPPNANPLDFGWQKDEHQKCLTPVMTKGNVPAAPDNVLKMIRCGCSSDLPCRSNRCGCLASQLSCTIFCQCSNNGGCQNKWTRNSESDDNE